MAKKSIKNSIKTTTRKFDSQNGVDTEDKFFILSTNELRNMPATLLQVSATDYAIANQAVSVSSISSRNGKGSTVYWTDTFYNTKDSSGKIVRKVTAVDALGGFRASDQNETRPALAPAFKIDIADLLSSNAKIDNDGITATIVFPDMQYPQKKVSEELAKELEIWYQTSQPQSSTYYLGSRSNNRIWRSDEKDYEYIYKGKRYVRVLAESIGTVEMNKFSDGSECKSGEIYWFEVSPIKWIVANWATCALNALAKNTKNFTNDIILRSEEAIIGGIPFHTQSNNNDQLGNFWQNSYIRAFLTGINIREALRNDNGNKSLSASQNYDFSNGAQNAFSNIVFKEAVQVEDEKDKESNPFGLKVTQTSKNKEQQLAFYVENGFSVMLHGRSGIGKTRRVQEIDPDYVMVRLRNGILPEEIIGKTAYNDQTGQSSWIQPTWYKQLWDICKAEPERNHVLLIDELTNVREYEQSLVYDIVLERSINGKEGKLPDNCVIVATGNNPQESSAAYNMPEPLFRRFHAHLYYKPDVKSWLEWGGEPHKKYPNRPKVHPAVLSFIASKGVSALFSNYDNENPPEWAVDPRSWEQVSDILYASGGEVDFALIKNKIGESLATDFLSFVTNQQITIDSIIAGTYNRSKLPRTANEKYAMTISLRWANENQVAEVRKFIKQNLGEENLKIFDSIWIENNDERAILIAELSNEEFSELE